MDWKSNIRFLFDELRVISRVLRHPNSSLPSKAIAACATAYVFSPIQLIPTFIPVVGQLDDAFVIWLAARAIRKITPEEVLSDCVSVCAVSRISGGLITASCAATNKENP